MKLLKHYGAYGAHRKFGPIAGLRGRLRRQPNTCGVCFVFREVYVDSTRAASVGLGQQDNKKANIHLYIFLSKHIRLSKSATERQKRMKDSYNGDVTEMKTKLKKKL